MSIEYIRKTYGVPAKRGGRVTVKLDGFDVGGTITGTRCAYLRIRLDGMRRSLLYHPTDHIVYACKVDGGQCGIGGYCGNCHHLMIPNSALRDGEAVQLESTVMQQKGGK